MSFSSDFIERSQLLSLQNSTEILPVLKKKEKERKREKKLHVYFETNKVSAEHVKLLFDPASIYRIYFYI